MNNSVFGKTYANQYDLLYGDKDYVLECKLLENIFQESGSDRVSSILDFGCGTGNHAIPLTQMGYHVVGIDASAEMLHVARKKAETAALEIELIEGDIRFANVNEQFDAGIFMFAVLGYMLSNEDVMAALTNARRHIRTEGILVFDVWYGPAVLNLRPTDRARVIATSKGKTLRVVNPTLDIRHHICNVHYHLWSLNGDHVETESEETHETRFFFPMELEFMLDKAGFILTYLTEFPTLNQPASEKTWNVIGVARAK